MRRITGVFLAAVALLAAEFFTNGQQAFAGRCGFEYTAPEYGSLLTAEEFRTKVAGHTVIGSDYKMYFGPDGTMTYYTNFEPFPGNWYSCGPVVVFRWLNDEHDTEYLFVMSMPGRLSFYSLKGRYIKTKTLWKGKIF